MKTTPMASLPLCLILIASGGDARAAVGCTLGNPAEDLKYLFPAMTSYKEALKSFPALEGGSALFQALRERVGSDLDPIYEAYDTPYTVYEVFQGDARIGVVHGVNVAGRGGVIQVFLSTDPTSGEIRKLFFQRLESPAAEELRSKAFRAQFETLTLGDFYRHDYYAAAKPGAPADRVGRITPPTVDAAGRPDYDAALRGIRKNLVLLDLFVYQRRFEPFHEQARQALRKRASTGGKP